MLYYTDNYNDAETQRKGIVAIVWLEPNGVDGWNRTAENIESTKKILLEPRDGEG